MRELFIDGDAVVDRQPGRFGQVGHRHRADADDDEIGVDRLAVRRAGSRALSPPVVDRLRSDWPQTSSTPSASMAPLDDRGDLGRHAAHQDARLRLDDGDLRAALAGAGGELQPDEAAADDRERGARRLRCARMASASAKVRR